jgi:hypothetical protein
MSLGWLQSVMLPVNGPVRLSTSIVGRRRSGITASGRRPWDAGCSPRSTASWVGRLLLAAKTRRTRHAIVDAMRYGTMLSGTGFPRADAENDVLRARRRQVLDRLAHRRRRQPEAGHILPLDEVVGGLGMRGKRYLGLQDIRLDRIVGTMDSRRDFDH